MLSMKLVAGILSVLAPVAAFAEPQIGETFQYSASVTRQDEYRYATCDVAHFGTDGKIVSQDRILGNDVFDDQQIAFPALCNGLSNGQSKFYRVQLRSEYDFQCREISSTGKDLGLASPSFCNL